VLILAFSGCSQIIEKNPFANQVAPEVLKPLKEIKTSQKVNKVWQVNTGLASGNNKINPFLDSQTIYIAGSGAASALDAFRVVAKSLKKTLLQTKFI